MGNRRGIVQTRTGAASVSHFQDPSLVIKKTRDPTDLRKVQYKARAKYTPYTNCLRVLPCKRISGCAVAFAHDCLCVFVCTGQSKRYRGEIVIPFCPVFNDLPPNTPMQEEDRNAEVLCNMRYRLPRKVAYKMYEAPLPRSNEFSHK